MSSVRPITVLNYILPQHPRVLTLRRIEQKIDDCTMAWQGGYKHFKIFIYNLISQ